MNTVVSLWIAAPVVGAAVVLQWGALRTRYRNELGKLHARHMHHHQIAKGNLEQAKRQIGQLQHDLAAARLQVKRLSVAAAPGQSGAPVKRTPARALGDEAASKRRLPADGFAEARPFLPSGRVDLLLR